MATATWAQDVIDEKPTVDTVAVNDAAGNLQAITLTATRKNTAFLSIPYSVSLLTQEDINRNQFRTTPEALVGTPGVFIQKTNHGGGSPFVRGLTGNQTLLLMDGIRLNNSTYRFGPNQYFNTIDPWTISKIEVARGTGSVQYGSDALGGVIQVFTQEPAFTKTPEWGGSIRGKLTTQDMEYSGRGTVTYQSEKLALVAGYSRKKFGDLYGGDTTGRQSPSGYQEQSLDVKLKYQLTANAVFILAHQWLRQEEVPLYHRVQLENFAYYNFAPQQRKLSYAKLELTGRHKLFQKITFISSFQNSLEHRDYFRNGNTNRFMEEDRVRTIGLVADVLSAISGSWTANSGIEYYHDKVMSSKQQVTLANNQSINQRGLYPNAATSGNFSLYSLHHIKKGDFDIEAGLRYNSFSIRIPDTVTTALKLGDITVRPSSLVGNLAVSFRLSQYQSVYGSLSTGYRAPNIDDLGTLGLVDFRYEIPAYDLQPEKTYNTEIGYRLNTKNITASVALFYMHLANLITRVPVPGQQVGGYNVYTKVNSQRSYMRGAEWSFHYRLGKALVIKNNMAWQYGQNLSANEPMRRIPPFNGSLLMEYQVQKWGAGAAYLFAGKQGRLAKGDRDDNRIPKGGTPGWQVMNVYGNYRLGQLKLFLSLQNIFNQDYRTHGSGINGMGRSCSMMMELLL